MKTVKFYVVFLFVLVAGVASLAAQQRIISGTVFDADEVPLVGVTVLVEGTTQGAITDLDGAFTLKTSPGTVVLNISYVGYSSQKITVRPDQANVTVHLQEDAILLNEMVVVGYGKQKKVNLTGAVATVEAGDLKNRVSTSLSNMLQGKVAGLNVTTSSGVPGSSASVNVRGVTSINAADPLVLVDGAVGDLDRVNPNDVESISVIKDASAAAIYGARAAFGVILVTTKSGQAKDGKATVHYSGRFGWQAPTTSTDYETTGYWSVYTINQFWQAKNGTLYVDYTDQDMQELWNRVNDKTEHPDRPWVVEQVRNGRNQWVYYGNYDWWHELFRDNHPMQQHDISISGGKDDLKYYLSGAFDRQEGILREHPDVYKRYNLRSKIDFRVNKWITMSNNTSFYSSQYSYLGDGSVENTLAYSSRHALACFPQKNPDGSWLYSTPYLNYKVANGRHILLGEDSHRNVDRTTDFSNTTRVVYAPFKTLSLTGDFTYRQYQTRNTSRSNPMYYREYPDGELLSYATGAGANRLDEWVNTDQYYSTNAYATFDDTFKEKHHLTAVAGINYEAWRSKDVSAYGENILSDKLDDLDLVGQNAEGATITGVGGGQNEYALFGAFARVNYDFMSRYLFEVSGRYDGTSRFAAGNRWGFFPSASVGWRISEEPFFKSLRDKVDNLKLRASFGSLGNQNISSYYSFARLVSIGSLNYSFGEGSVPSRYAALSAPIASDMTWETAQQWDFGFDLTMFNNRLNLTVDGYVRNTLDMLTDGIELPAVYGASVPDMNTADLRTKGYEISLSWSDRFTLAGRAFDYSIGFNLSDYKSVITRYDNKDKTFAKSYYEGMELGEIWGFVTDGLFQSDEEAQAYADQVILTYMESGLTGGWKAGDVKFVDLNNDGKVDLGSNTVDNPGDRKKLGNSLPSFNYGITGSARWSGIDVSLFFQGTGKHEWYPTSHLTGFWGPYSYPYMTYLPQNFLDNVWSEDNRDAYFPRAMAYSSTSGPLSKVNDRYIQNLRYLRFKNLTIGYTLPEAWTRKVNVDAVRIFFTGENLCYWSPFKKHTKYVDPEAAIDRSSDVDNEAFYPWQKTFMFGVDITF